MRCSGPWWSERSWTLPRMSRRCSGVALAAHVGQPDRQVVRIDGGDGRRVGIADPAADAVDEQPAGVARTADHRHAGGGVRDGPEARDLGPLLDARPT